MLTFAMQTRRQGAQSGYPARPPSKGRLNILMMYPKYPAPDQRTNGRI